MRKNILMILITTLCVAAIGQFTCNEVKTKIQMRRRSGRRKTELAILAANMRNGKLGINTHLPIA